MLVLARRIKNAQSSEKETQSTDSLEYIIFNLEKFVGFCID
jgi:hypothetical protein